MASTTARTGRRPARWDGRVKALVYIGRGGSLIGILGLGSQLRTNSRGTVQRWREGGVKEVLMLSGDQRQVAERIVEACGLGRCLSELLPEQKARVAEEL